MFPFGEVDRHPYLRIDREGRVLDTLAWQPLEGRRVPLEAEGAMASLTLPFPHEPLVVLMIDQERIAEVERPPARGAGSTEFGIRWTTFDGDTLGARRYPYRPLRLDPALGTRAARARLPLFAPSFRGDRILLLPLLLSACWGEAAEWSEADHRAIFAVALEAMQQELEADTLVVDPRPRFLVHEEEADLYRMGEPNRYGDPGFSAVIRGLPAVVECDLVREGFCDAGTTREFVALSEVIPVGSRQAAILAVRVELAPDARVTGSSLIHFRLRGGEWRVTAMEESDVVRVRGARAPG